MKIYRRGVLLCFLMICLCLDAIGQQQSASLAQVHNPVSTKREDAGARGTVRNAGPDSLWRIDTRGVMAEPRLYLRPTIRGTSMPGTRTELSMDSVSPQDGYAETFISDGLDRDSLPAIRKKIDGVASVVGDYVILDSDGEKLYADLESQGATKEDITPCQLLGKLMEDRLYAHHAVQDSLLVADDQINARIDQQIQQLTSRIGSTEEMLAYYKKSDLVTFREELFKINRLQMLSDNMRNKVVEEVEVTPEEVRQFFLRIPESELPVFGAELEIAQIVKAPKPSEEEKQRVIDQLRKIREDVVERSSNFSIKAVLYSEDPGSKDSGGAYSITRQTPFVKEFKDVAFSLNEGEVSEPFETQFGYHIIYMERIRGQERDLRHILMIPRISEESILEARMELDTIRQAVLDGKYTFAEAAEKFSDEEETKYDGGQLRNPYDFGSRFELTKMDPVLYNQVRDLQEDQISSPLREEDPRGGPARFKIMKVTNRFNEHRADFGLDYLKIQELALREKQLKTIGDWIDSKIDDTYIQVNDSYKDCNFANDWIKE